MTKIVRLLAKIGGIKKPIMPVTDTDSVFDKLGNSLSSLLSSIGVQIREAKARIEDVFSLANNANTIASYAKPKADSAYNIASQAKTNADNALSLSHTKEQMFRMFCGDYFLYKNESGWHEQFLEPNESYTRKWSGYLVVSMYAVVKEAIDLSKMFYNCRSLETLEMHNSRKVTNLESMLAGCSILKSVRLQDFHTGNVTNMYAMFNSCISLISLDLSGFDTSNVTNMGIMFGGCRSLISLDLSGFDTSNVSVFNNVFYNCNSLTSLRVGEKWNKGFSIEKTGLQHDGLVQLFDDLPSISSSQAILLGSTKLGYLSDEEKAIATAKGWTLA